MPSAPLQPHRAPRHASPLSVSTIPDSWYLVKVIEPARLGSFTCGKAAECGKVTKANPRTHSHCSSSSFSPNLQIDDKQVQGESVPPRSRPHLAILCHSTMTELSVLYRSCSEMIEKLQPIFEISNKFSQQRSIGINTPGTKPQRNNKYTYNYIQIVK
jgi:hypothetical protein